MRAVKFSPSFVLAMLALVLATAGTGLAAKTYLITSSRQIKDGAVEHFQVTMKIGFRLEDDE